MKIGYYESIKKFKYQNGLVSAAQCRCYASTTPYAILSPPLQQLKGEVTNTILPSCLNSVSQLNYFRTNGNFYGLTFYSLTAFSVKCYAHDPVHLDIYHPPFVTELYLPLKRSNLSCIISFGRHFFRDYLVLKNTHPAYDWSSRYNETSIDGSTNSCCSITCNWNRCPYWLQ
jgi:hypothetical protein